MAGLTRTGHERMPPRRIVGTTGETGAIRRIVTFACAPHDLSRHRIRAPERRLKILGKPDISQFMATRQTTVTTPLGDKLLFHRMTGREELGRLSYYDVELFSETDDVDPNALLGQLMTANVALPSGKLRYFQGHVSRFARIGCGASSNAPAVVVAADPQGQLPHLSESFASRRDQDGVRRP